MQDRGGEHKNEPSNKQIHLIWLGSVMRDTKGFDHVNRVKEWAKINKEYKVTVWVQQEFLPAIQKQFESTPHINICDIAAIKLSPKVTAWAEELGKKGNSTPNYAAVSDLYRFAILKEHGGWYVDTDVYPVDLSKHTIHDIGIYFCGQLIKPKGDFFEVAHQPSVIYATKDNKFHKLSMLQMELFAARFNKPEHTQKIRSTDPDTRKTETLETTGNILSYTLQAYIINDGCMDAPILYKSSLTYNLLYKQLVSPFKSIYESSWLFQDITRAGASVTCVLLDGLSGSGKILIKNYNHGISNNAQLVIKTAPEKEKAEAKTVESKADAKSQIHVKSEVSGGTSAAVTAALASTNATAVSLTTSQEKNRNRKKRRAAKKLEAAVSPKEFKTDVEATKKLMLLGAKSSDNDSVASVTDDENLVASPKNS